MSIANTSESGREIVVWDPLVRLIHWSVAISILLNSTIIEEESAQHELIGYLAAGLVVVRLIWGVVGTRNAKFTAFPPNPLAALNHLREIIKGDRTVYLSHNPLGALMVYNIWATILFLCITGYMMGTAQFFGVEWVEELHEAAFAWLIFSILLHILGVVYDTWRSGVPLIRSMITGQKRVLHGQSISE